MKKDRTLLTLFITMLKIGAFTFGGGYAMIPLIEDEFATRKKYVSSEEIADIIALSQSIPGAIAVNASIIIGYRMKGLAGALAAIFGLALPSFVVLALITYLYQSFNENPYVAAALKGIRASVVALIFSAFLRLFSRIKKNAYTITLLIASFLVSLFFDFNSVYIILSGILIGLVSNLFIKEKEVNE
ncbi:MAG: chromate transporter [Eubacteriales bacterium]